MILSVSIEEYQRYLLAIEMRIADAATEDEETQLFDTRDVFLSELVAEMEAFFELIAFYEHDKTEADINAARLEYLILIQTKIDVVLAAGTERHPRNSDTFEAIEQGGVVATVMDARMTSEEKRGFLDGVQRNRVAHLQAKDERADAESMISEAVDHDERELRRAWEQEQAIQDAHAAAEAAERQRAGPSPEQQAEMAAAIQMQQQQMALEKEDAEARLAAALADLQRQADLLREEAERQALATEQQRLDYVAAEEAAIRARASAVQQAQVQAQAAADQAAAVGLVKTEYQGKIETARQAAAAEQARIAAADLARAEQGKRRVAARAELQGRNDAAVARAAEMQKKKDAAVAQAIEADEAAARFRQRVLIGGGVALVLALLIIAWLVQRRACPRSEL